VTVFGGFSRRLTQKALKEDETTSSGSEVYIMHTALIMFGLLMAMINSHIGAFRYMLESMVIPAL
jgi:predicted thioesterase